jgi:hypothetical protein
MEVVEAWRRGREVWKACRYGAGMQGSSARGKCAAIFYGGSEVVSTKYIEEDDATGCCCGQTAEVANVAQGTLSRDSDFTWASANSDRKNNSIIISSLTPV